MELITGAILGLCFFMLSFWAYRRGIKDGIALNKGKAIQPIQTPIQAVKKHTEAKKADKKQQEESQGLQNIMNYDPFAKEVTK